MDKQEVLNEVLLDCLGVKREQLTDEARFVEDLSADSLTVMEIVMAVEEKFGLELTEEQVENIRSVGAVARVGGAEGGLSQTEACDGLAGR